jgi:hypothetical protein
MLILYSNSSLNVQNAFLEKQPFQQTKLSTGSLKDTVQGECCEYAISYL